MIAAPETDWDGTPIIDEWDWIHADGKTTSERQNPIGLECPICDVVAGLANAYDKGVLPWPGSYMDQPARAMLAIRAWNNAVQAYQDLPEARRRAAGGG